MNEQDKVLQANDEAFALAMELGPLVQKHMDKGNPATIGLAISYLLAGIASKIDGTIKKQREFISSTFEICSRMHRSTAEKEHQQQKGH